jgi:hypothetical protein
MLIKKIVVFLSFFLIFILPYQILLVTLHCQKERKQKTKFWSYGRKELQISSELVSQPV